MGKILDPICISEEHFGCCEVVGEGRGAGGVLTDEMHLVQPFINLRTCLFLSLLPMPVLLPSKTRPVLTLPHHSND